jgi:hypothetical protein
MHRPTRHPVLVPPTQWDKMILAFEGDILGQSCTTVEWPATAFWQVSNGAALQVPTLVNLDALFDADPLLQMVGPFAANEVGTELVRTRNVMFLPPRYIAIALGQSLTPREAYLRIGRAIRAMVWKWIVHPSSPSFVLLAPCQLASRSLHLNARRQPCCKWMAPSISTSGRVWSCAI